MLHRYCEKIYLKILTAHLVDLHGLDFSSMSYMRPSAQINQWSTPTPTAEYHLFTNAFNKYNSVLLQFSLKYKMYILYCI